MTLQEILNQIKALYPRAGSAFSDAEIVDILNIIQDTIFDELQVKSTYDFITISDTDRYSFPADMQACFIKTVLMSHSASTDTQTGTVSVTAGAATVTGSGTSFTSALEGEYIVINDELKIVDTVSTTESMTVTENFAATASAVAWELYDSPEEGSVFYEIPYKDYADVLTRTTEDCWFHYIDDDEEYIGFYPDPSTTGKTVRVIYRPTPTAMSESALSTSPDLHYRWHVLLVYGAINEIAASGSNPDTTIANNYARKFNEILAKATQNRYERDKPGYIVTENKYPRTWNHARLVMTGRKNRFSRYSYEDI